MLFLGVAFVRGVARVKRKESSCNGLVTVTLSIAWRSCLRSSKQQHKERLRGELSWERFKQRQEERKETKTRNSTPLFGSKINTPFDELVFASIHMLWEESVLQEVLIVTIKNNVQRRRNLQRERQPSR